MRICAGIITWQDGDALANTILSVRDVVDCFERIRPFPGVPGALGKLRDAGLRLAVLSDFPPGRKLELMGLSAWFDIALGELHTLTPDGWRNVGTD